MSPIVHRGHGGPPAAGAVSGVRVYPEDVYQDLNTGEWWLRQATYWTELPDGYLADRGVDQTVPVETATTFTGQVINPVGGGDVTIRVDHDTPSYPSVGDVVDVTVRVSDECDAILTSTKTTPTRRTQVRCQERGTHPLHRARLVDADGTIQTLEWGS